MNSFTLKLKAIFSILLILILSSCSNDNDPLGGDTPKAKNAGASNITPKENTKGANDVSPSKPDSNTIPITVKGILVDGYIQGATICIDINEDSICNVYETKTVTNAKGEFSLTTNVSKSKSYTLIGTGGIDTATKGGFASTYKSIIIASQSIQRGTSNNYSVNVTPLSTLTSNIYNKQIKTNSDYELNSAVNVVSNAMGIASTKLLNDPLKDIELFEKTQVIVQTVKIMSTSIRLGATQIDETKSFDFVMDSLSSSMENNKHIGKLEISELANELEKSTFANAKIVIPKSVEDTASKNVASIRKAVATLENNVSKNNEVNVSQLASIQASTQSEANIVSVAQPLAIIISKESLSAPTLEADAPKTTTLNTIKIKVKGKVETKLLINNTEAGKMPIGGMYIILDLSGADRIIDFNLTLKDDHNYSAPLLFSIAKTTAIDVNASTDANSTGTNTTTPTIVTPPTIDGNTYVYITPRNVKGSVVDGPLYKAKVYLDLNGNNDFDNNEPFALTDANGTYDLKASSADLDKYKLLVILTDETIDTETNKSLGAYTMTYFSPAVKAGLSASLQSDELSINAFTSLIQDEIEQGMEPIKAVETIGLLLGLEPKDYRLLVVDFWNAKKTGKVNGVTLTAEQLKTINRLHNIARVYVRALSIKLHEVTEANSYTTQQKGFITHLLLNAIKPKLSNIMSNEDKVADADILAKELSDSISVSAIPAMVASHNFATVPNKPIVVGKEFLYSLDEAISGIELNWKMFYGKNANKAELISLPEGVLKGVSVFNEDSPNEQKGRFIIKQTQEGVFAYKICLSNANGQSCSHNFTVKIIKQSNSVNSYVTEKPSKYPLLAEGEFKKRPGKPEWNGWMQGVKSSKFIKTGVWHNLAWSKWGGLIADEYTYLRCISVNLSSDTPTYECDDIKIENNFASTAKSTWDHWVDGAVEGKAGGQVGSIAATIANDHLINYYHIDNGVEIGKAYVYQVKLCRTIGESKHCSVSDPLRLYITPPNGNIPVTKTTPTPPKDTNDTDIVVPIPPENSGGNEDANQTPPDTTPPGQTTSGGGTSSADITKNQTPLAKATVNYVSGSWQAFALNANIDIKMTKYYGNIGANWKLEVYKYGLTDTIDKESLDSTKIMASKTKSGTTGIVAVSETATFAGSFTFSEIGMYAFKGYLCSGTGDDVFCQPSSNTQIIQVGGTKQAVKVAPPAVTPPSSNSNTGEETKFESLSDVEYARLEQEKRSDKLKDAITRIVTLPISKHKIVNGKDEGPDLSLNFANVQRVESIYLAKYAELVSAQASGKINDFDTTTLTGLTDFKKGELAWQWLFPMANGHIKQFPNSYNDDVKGGKYPYTYTNFLKATAKYPKFCGDHADVNGDNADNLCKLSMSMMFAHFAQEVGGHLGSPNDTYKLPFSEKRAIPSGQIGSGGAMKTFDCREIPGQVTNWCAGFKDGVSMIDKNIPEYRQALYWVNESGCSESGAGCDYRSCTAGTWQAEAWPCPATTKYFGRGPKQLSYNYNYGPFSDIIFGDVNVLLRNPAKVTEGWLAFASATYFFMQPRPPKPSMYELIYGHWTPNDKASSDGLSRDMGTSIMIINGGIECGGTNAIAQADNRVKYYSGFLDYFGMTGKIDLDNRTSAKYNCKDAQQFGTSHGANYLNSWAKDWTGTCKIVGWETAYSGFTDGAFKSCYEKEILGK